MQKRFHIEMNRQPDETSCGPTCLHALYRYFGDPRPLAELLPEIEMLESGGTLAVILATHALRSGYNATVYNYNLQIFDPTWSGLGLDEMIAKLREQMRHKDSNRLRASSKAYIEFLTLGGELHFDDLTPGLLARLLAGSTPVLTGLNSTYLYREPRTNPDTDESDDIGGEPTGHFVILCGYDKTRNQVQVADPYIPNLVQDAHFYEVPAERLICAILLGVLTYDGTLIIIEPKQG